MARQVKSGPAKLKKAAEKEQLPAKERRKPASKSVDPEKKLIAKPRKKATKQPVKTPKEAKPETKPATSDRKITKSKQRKPHATRPTAREKLEIAKRQELVVELFEGGASFRQIGEHLILNGHKRTSKSTVERDLKDCLDRTIDATDLNTKHIRKIQVSRLTKLFLTFNQEALKKKDPKAGELALKYIKELDRYLNASKAQQSENDARAGLARLLGVNPEELPDDRNDDT